MTLMNKKENSFYEKLSIEFDHSSKKIFQKEYQKDGSVRYQSSNDVLSMIYSRLVSYNRCAVPSLSVISAAAATSQHGNRPDWPDNATQHTTKRTTTFPLPMIETSGFERLDFAAYSVRAGMIQAFIRLSSKLTPTASPFRLRSLAAAS